MDKIYWEDLPYDFSLTKIDNIFFYEDKMVYWLEHERKWNKPIEFFLDKFVKSSN